MNAPFSEIAHGDLRAVLPAFAEHTFDACVCDPPYELGFMGKAWDSSGIAFDPETWRYVWRVLKPGAHMVAFGGTRTWHRIAVAIEDAGFEIRDNMAWLYGCLDEESEILTENGWKRGLDVAGGERVAAWDPADESIRIVPVLETFRAPFDGELVCFHNDNTCQRLTPNHRVFKKHALREQKGGKRRRFFEGAWSVAQAGEINRHQPIKLPLAGYHDGDGVGGTAYAAFLAWVFTEGGFDATGTGVRITQSSVNPEHVGEIDRLVSAFAPNAKRYRRTRTYSPANGEPYEYVEHTWFFSGEPARAVRELLPGKRPTFDLLWRMSLAEKSAFLAAALRGDGSAMQFYQKNDADREWLIVLAHTSGWQGRDNPAKACTSLHANAATELQARHLSARNRERYAGDVWCVRVETGAFVARRNGRVFITGNSGFPKSMALDKAIDKAAGAEREVVGTQRLQGNAGVSTALKGGTYSVGAGLTADVQIPITAAATELAKQWVGWGTALKPSFEPIILARKPPIGTVAANVEAYGVGGIHIDACRTPAEKPGGWTGGGGGIGGTGTGCLHGGTSLERSAPRPVDGRWPPNVIADELVAADLDATNGVKTSGKMKAGTVRGTRQGAVFGEMGESTTTTTIGDSGGVSRYFYCPKANGKERDAGLDHWPALTGGAATDREDGSPGTQSPRAGAGRTGGRRNPHPTVKPIELMRWLCRLVTPAGGWIVDPFVGSGTTGAAAALEGFNFVGVELGELHARLARDRIAYWMAQIAAGTAKQVA